LRAPRSCCTLYSLEERFWQARVLSRGWGGHERSREAARLWPPGCSLEGYAPNLGTPLLDEALRFGRELSTLCGPRCNAELS
jgi:hypothetical protein